MATYFPTQNGRIKIQAETLLGTSPTNGWVYQPPGTGNNATGAQGGYYYFKSESLDGSVKSATQGLFSATVYVAEAGTYTLRVRTARDTNDPGDSRNDIWVRVDDDIHDVLPEGTVAIGATASGFGKLKGANTAWGYAKAFAAEGEEDANPPSQVVLTQGFHTITFAGRSVGLHIDFFELVKAGLNVAATAADTAAVTGPVLPAAASVDEDASLVLDVLSGQSGYTVTAATDPAHGTTVVNADKTIRYTPDADFFGTDTFTFTVADARGAVTTQRMTMTVAGTPDAPAAAGDTASTVKGTAVSVAVLGNDADPDGTSVAINSFEGKSTFGGTVTKVGNQLVYTPLAGFTGTDTFTYDIVDPTGRVSERATVAVAVADGPVGGLPIVVGVYDADTDALVDLLADGDVLDAALVDGSMTFSVSVVAGSALDGQVGSVKLRLSGDASATRTESGAPYSLFGDKDGDYAGGADLGVGSYKLEVDVYSMRRRQGHAARQLRLRLRRQRDRNPRAPPRRPLQRRHRRARRPARGRRRPLGGRGRRLDDLLGQRRRRRRPRRPDRQRQAPPLGRRDRQPHRDRRPLQPLRRQGRRPQGRRPLARRGQLHLRRRRLFGRRGQGHAARQLRLRLHRLRHALRLSRAHTRGISFPGFPSRRTGPASADGRLNRLRKGPVPGGTA